MQNAAVVGFGHLGKFHAQKYAELAQEGLVKLVALVDPDLEGAKKKAKSSFPDLEIPVFASVRDLLAAEKDGKIPTIHLASVATPTSDHHTVGMELLRAGKHILVEKPIASNVKHAEELVQEARTRRLVLAVGQVERYRAHEVLGEVPGMPHFIECHRLSPFPQRSTDIDVVLDLMIHDIDLMLALVDSPIKLVQATGIPVLTNQADIANARFEFANGCVANITASRISITRTRKFRVFSSDCYISLDLGAGTFERYHKDPKEADLMKAIQHKGGTLSVADALKAEVKDFILAAKAGGRPLVSGEDGQRALAVADQVLADVHRRIREFKGPTGQEHARP